MASVMNEKKDPSNALQVYEHALQLDPEYPESYTGKAYTLLALGQYELAL
jgi:cytochrome c-type biogenesis protein CcmH/NrfG